MTLDAELSQSQEERLQEVIAAYLRDVEAGRNPNQAELLSCHPDLAGELQSFFAGQEQIGRLAAPLRQVVEPTLGDGITGTLGDFRIVREVGRGGMGIVYEAEQISLRRRVALKVLPFAATMDARHLQRFHNEAQAAACLHHTNIVPVYFVGSERGVHFYAMQFIDGQPLSEIIHQLRQAEKMEPAAGTASQPSPTEPPAANPTICAAGDVTPQTGEGKQGRGFFRTAAQLGVQAAEALEHAHQLGIVHRDIKPANLLVDGRGNLWITDFGLAHCQSQVGLTMSGDLVGTLRYMSPEQALGHRLLVDHRTDIYSLGVTLYESLTLQPPFAGNDRQELLRQIAFEEPKPPRRLNKTIPAELEIIILKAMAKEPSERYASAHDLADDLRYYLEDRPIWAKRPTWMQRLRKWQRRHRAAVATGVISFVLLLVGAVAALIISTVRITQERNQKDEALQQKDEALQQSRASQEAATRRLKQSLKVIDHMMWLTHQPLVDTPQMRPLRSRSYEEALQLYEPILAEVGSDPELRLEMAQTYYHVGVYRVALGQLIEAEEAFRRGIALAKELVAEYPDQLDYRRALALNRWSYSGCLEAVGGLSEERGSEARAALELWLSLAKEFPTERECRRCVGQCQRQLASWLWDIGHPAEAEQYLRQALTMHQKLATDVTDDPGTTIEVIEDWTRLGGYLHKLGQASEAESAYRNALKEARKLHAAFPYTLSARRRLAVAQGELGIRLCVRGQRDEGREFLSQAIAGWRELLKDVQDEPAYAEEAGEIQLELGRIFEGNERSEEAVKAFRQALDYFEATARRAPGVWQKRRCWMQAIDCLGKLGRLSRLQGRFPQAEEALRRSLALSQQLFDEFPQESEQRRRLADSHSDLAWFFSVRPDHQPHHAAEALAHAQKAVALQPEHHDFWHTLGVAHCRLGHWKEALECIEKSRKLENNPRPPGAFDRFFESMAYSGLGDKANARRCYNEGVQWMQKNAPNHADLHRFRAEAAALLQIAEQQTQPKDPKDAKKPN